VFLSVRWLDGVLGWHAAHSPSGVKKWMYTLGGPYDAPVLALAALMILRISSMVLNH
jgi:hypothetical protein